MTGDTVDGDPGTPPFSGPVAGRDSHNVVRYLGNDMFRAPCGPISWEASCRFRSGPPGESVSAKIRLKCRLCAEATLRAWMTRPYAVPNQAKAVPTRPT